METMETYGEWRKRRDRQEFWTSNCMVFVITIFLTLFLIPPLMFFLLSGEPRPWLRMLAAGGASVFVFSLLCVVQRVLRVWWKL